MAARETLIGSAAASQLCGISASLLAYRAKTGKILFARRKPLRFRVADIIEARERMALKDPRGRKPGPQGTKLEHLIARTLEGATA
jgi:hypothetical protein